MHATSFHLLGDDWYVQVRDPSPDGVAAWLEVHSGESALRIFGSREQLRVISHTLADHFSSREKGDSHMPKGKRPDYVANTVVEVGDGKSRWHPVGVAFVNARSDTITLELDALPVNGKIVLTRPKEKDDAKEGD